MVRRFVECCVDHPYGGARATMLECVNGGYVLHSDYAALESHMKEVAFEQDKHIATLTIDYSALLAQRDMLVEELESACSSLEALGERAGRDYMLQDVVDVRIYASSRATVAKAALAKVRGE